jgi:LysM repeat protein
MWVFTEIADWFDKTRQDNEKFIDSELQPWVATTLYEDHSWYRNVGVWTAAGTLYALNKFTTTVAAGFVDVLRLGDGVQEGGWGYGKDALRLLMVVGPVLRGARYVIAGIQELDVGQAALNQLVKAGTPFATALKTIPWAGNCGWVAATRALRVTGTGVFSELSDVARAAGMDIADTGGLKSVTELQLPLRVLGASTKVAQVKGGMTGLAELVAENPNGVVMFGVRWPGGGHALLAFRNFFGGLSLLDRSGKIYASLADLPYKGIANGVIDAKALVINNSLAVTSLETVPTLANVITQASTDFGRIPESNTNLPQSASQTQASAGSSAGASTSAHNSGTITSGTLTVTTNTVCIQRNSDVPVTCSPVQTKTYKVGAGESLSIIAHRVYGDVSRWKDIADVNGIKPPKYTIYPGQNLFLP